MSREIKFRAYIKSLQWLLPVERICFDCGTVEIDLTGGNGDTAEYEFDECELMQFTGLYDKNKKEIYTGDIIRYSTDPFGQKGTFTYSVIFEQGQFRTEKSSLWAVHLVCEVIGNIYENVLEAL